MDENTFDIMSLFPKDHQFYVFPTRCERYQDNQAQFRAAIKNNGAKYDRLPKALPSKTTAKIRNKKNLSRAKRSLRKTKPFLSVQAEKVQRKNRKKHIEHLEEVLSSNNNDANYKASVSKRKLIQNQTLRRSKRLKSRA